MIKKSGRLVRCISARHKHFSSGVKDEVGKHIRRAQAVEVFRASYCQYSNVGGNSDTVSVSVADIDDILIDSKVRPSALLGAFSVAGGLLGVASALSPIKQCTQLMNKIVDEATETVLNDSVRDISITIEDGGNSGGNANAYGDIKDTLKFHRDVRIVDEDTVLDSIRDAESATKGEKTLLTVHETLRSGLSSVLKISDVV